MTNYTANDKYLKSLSDYVKQMETTELVTLREAVTDARKTTDAARKAGIAATARPQRKRSERP